MEETRDKGNREEGKLEKERERKGITDQMVQEEEVVEEEEEDSPLLLLQTQHVLKTQFST